MTLIENEARINRKSDPNPSAAEMRIPTRLPRVHLPTKMTGMATIPVTEGSVVLDKESTMVNTTGRSPGHRNYEQEVTEAAIAALLLATRVIAAIVKQETTSADGNMNTNHVVDAMTKRSPEFLNLQ